MRSNLDWISNEVDTLAGSCDLILASGSWDMVRYGALLLARGPPKLGSALPLFGEGGYQLDGPRAVGCAVRSPDGRGVLLASLAGGRDQRDPLAELSC